MRFLLLFASIGLDCGCYELPRPEPTPDVIEEADLAVDLATFPADGLVIPSPFCVYPTVNLADVPVDVTRGPDGVRLSRDTVLGGLSRLLPWRHRCEFSQEMDLELRCLGTVTQRKLIVGLAGRAPVTVGPLGDEVSPLAVAHALLPGDTEMVSGHVLVDLQLAPFHTIVRDDGLRELAWWPEGGFAAGRTYDVILQGGSGGLRMADLRCLDEPHRWTITTRTEPVFQGRFEDFEGERWVTWDDLGLATYTVTAGGDELARDTREVALPLGRHDGCVHVTAHVERDTTFDVETEVCP